MKIYCEGNQVNHKIKLRTLLLSLIILTAITGIAALLSGKFIHQTKKSIVEETQYQNSEVVMTEHSVMQEFYPKQENLAAIQIMIDSDGQNGGLFYFNLYDQNLNKLFTTVQRIRYEEGKAQLFYRFPISTEVVPGVPYYYTIDYKDVTFSVTLAEKNPIQESDNGKAFYALKEIPNMQVVSIYEYKEELSTQQTLFGVLIIIVMAALLAAVSAVALAIARKNISPSVSVIVKGYFTEVVVFLTGYSLYEVLKQKVFTYNLVDNLLLATTVGLLAALGLYLIWRKYPKPVKPNAEICKRFAVHILEAFLFAKTMLACIDFVNAGSNYAQGLALREMCSWFGLAMLVMSMSIILHSRIRLALLSVYTVAAVVIGYQYSVSFQGTGEPYETAYRTAIMVGIWGILLLLTLIDTIQYRPRFSFRNVLLAGTFFGCLLLFRRSNIWELAVVIPFTIFIIRTALYQKTSEVLKFLENGVILSFLIVTAQSLMHRPFHYYIYIRYSGVFTTVTVTSVYLALVFAVVVVRLVGKLQQSDDFSNLWFELTLLGLVSGYQFLTLSRTGMMTCVGVYIIAFFFFYIANRKKLFRTTIRAFIYSIAFVFVGVICVFGLTRMIPALVNDPFMFEIEEFQDSIHEGEPINSARYITFDRFMGLSSERILGKSIEEQTSEETVSGSDIIKEQPTSTEAEMPEAENHTTQEENTGVSTELSTVSSEYSNGRFDIFKNYLNNLNLEGHDAVGLTLEDGSTIIHAHNSFIQMAYDCGILTGFIFIVLYIMLGFRSIRYYFRRYKSDQTAMMPMLIFAAFGIASMVEYVFRPTIPLGFVFLAMCAPLLTQFEHHDKNTKRKV